MGPARRAVVVVEADDADVVTDAAQINVGVRGGAGRVDTPSATQRITGRMSAARRRRRFVIGYS
jgi:hypothetical protein